MDIAGLQKNVGFLNWVAAAAAVALVALYFILSTQIETRFDKLDVPVREIQASVAGQSATLNAIDARLARSEDKLDAKPETSPRKR